MRSHRIAKRWINRLWRASAVLLALSLALAAGPGGVAVAQVRDEAPSVSLEAVAAALDAGDLDAMRAAAADPALLQGLRQSDPDTLIEFQLALAAAYAEAGLKDEAIRAYEAALVSILQFRGQTHETMIAPLTAVALLASDPAVKARWLLSAYEIRETIWGPSSLHLAPYRDELNAARTAAGLLPIETRAAPPPGAPNFDLVNVYYATHRATTGRAAPASFFGGNRGGMAYGVAEVSVPRDRARGEVPRPSVWTFEFRPDPDKHMILNRITPVTDRDSFFRRVSETLSRTERKEAFVFIHGYNTSFEGAAIRAAQLAVDTNLDGAPILYSWPSRASLLGYGADTRAVADEALLDDVADFLTDVATQTGAERVHLVAHSMGNRVLVRALDRIAERQSDLPIFNEVILAAADVGVDEFETTFPRILGTGDRFTLYASRRDRALQISQQVNQMRRIGDARDVVVRDGLQTVDTTAASAGLLGHDDFAGSALADFRAVMWLSLAPERRCVLETAETAGGRYWAFGGGGCPEQEFEEATQLVRANGTVEQALARLDEDISKAATATHDLLRRKRERLTALFGVSSASTTDARP